MFPQVSDLVGKTYLVTGASSGIGAATALALGRAGARVAVAARRVEALASLAAEIRGAGGEAIALRTDVSVEDSVRAAVSATLAHFGRLDGAFNNAGILGPATPLHQTESAEFENLLRTNVLGVFWAMKYEIAAILESGGGAIVNNASLAAEVGFANLAPYVSSKHAVMGLTRNAALEYFKQGIRINAVNPGPIATPMAELGFGGADQMRAALADSPAGRPGLPEEVAGPVLFLLSDAARYISGEGLMVDGGYVLQ